MSEKGCRGMISRGSFLSFVRETLHGDNVGFCESELDLHVGFDSL